MIFKVLKNSLRLLNFLDIQKNEDNINTQTPNEKVSDFESSKDQKIFEYIKPSDQSIDENINFQNNEKFSNINEFDINNFDINKVSKSQIDLKDKAPNINFDGPEDFKNLSPRGKASQISSKIITSKYDNINQNLNQGNPQAPKITVLPARKSEVSEKDIQKIEEIIGKKIKPIDTSKFHKKLDFTLPVRYKTPDYYKLATIISKLMSNAIKDMDANNPDKATENLELANYYLTKVIK